MTEIVLAAVGGFALSFVATLLIRPVAIRFGVVDNPDGRRKLHRQAIPVVGGPILLFSVTVPLLFLVLRSETLRAQGDFQGRHLLGLLLASVVICGIGILDDVGRLRGRHKLLGQLLAVSVLLAFGLRIDHARLFDVDFNLGIVGVPFAAFFLLGAINSLNLIDGMDGLLSSVAFVVCVSFGSIALLSGQDVTACVAFTLAGALLAFLFFNFPPATIFLGDSGSMFIGLVIGAVAIDSSLKRPATISLATPAALFTLPILDTVAAIVRRKLTGRSIYSTDRGHLHHCLLRRFPDPRRVLLIILICCLATATGAISGQVLGSEAVVILSSTVVVLTLIATRLFGHAELMLLTQWLRMFVKSTLRLRPANEPRQLEMRLQGSADWRFLWMRILAAAGGLNLHHVRLIVNAPSLGEGYHARWDSPHRVGDEEGRLWRVQLPLTAPSGPIGELDVIGHWDDDPLESKIASLSRILREFVFSAPVPDGGEMVAQQPPALSASPVHANGVPKPSLHQVNL